MTETTTHSEAQQAFVECIERRDAAALEALLGEHPELRADLDRPWFPFGATALIFARRDRAVVDVLLEAGADIHARSDWWAGSFGVLDDSDPETVAYLVSRGARIDAHVAAEQGDLDQLQRLVTEDPTVVCARGGDGKHPLHNAKTVEVAAFLLDAGAEIDARDIDHDSTPTQHLIRRSPDVSRFLLERGAGPDLFLAAALDDLALAEAVLERRPDSVHHRIGLPPFAPTNERQGGHIYQWTLGFDLSPHDVAWRREHREMFSWLMERSPPEVKLPVHCMLGDRLSAEALVKEDPGVVTRLPDGSKALLAVAAWNNELEIVRLMLDLGFDPHARGGEGSTPLDRAAFHGFHEVIELLLDRDPEPPLEWQNDYGGTVLGCALFGSQHSWRDDGNAVATVRRLIAAGSRVESAWIPTGSTEIDRLLEEALARQQN